MGCASPTARPVAPLAEDSRFAPCVEEPSEGVLGEWEGVAIRYADGRPTVPLHRVEIVFSPSYVGWGDGCNVQRGRYLLLRDRLVFDRVQSTDVACDGAVPNLLDVDTVAFDGSQLILSAPGEHYVFRRKPYSVLTRRAWSLFSITDVETGETQKVDQLRRDQAQLLMVTEADARFTFTDVDYSKWSGTMTVGLATHAVELAWDNRTRTAFEIRRRVAKRREIEGTADRKPPQIAARLDWTQVGAFCLVEHESIYGPSLMLELRGDRYVYTWSPR